MRHGIQGNTKLKNVPRNQSEKRHTVCGPANINSHSSFKNDLRNVNKSEEILSDISDQEGYSSSEGELPIFTESSNDISSGRKAETVESNNLCDIVRPIAARGLRQAFRVDNLSPMSSKMDIVSIEDELPAEDLPLDKNSMSTDQEGIASLKKHSSDKSGLRPEDEEEEIPDGKLTTVNGSIEETVMPKNSLSLPEELSLKEREKPRGKASWLSSDIQSPKEEEILLELFEELTDNIEIFEKEENLSETASSKESSLAIDSLKQPSSIESESSTNLKSIEVDLSSVEEQLSNIDQTF